MLAVATVRDTRRARRARDDLTKRTRYQVNGFRLQLGSLGVAHTVRMPQMPLLVASPAVVGEEPVTGRVVDAASAADDACVDGFAGRRGPRARHLGS